MFEKVSRGRPVGVEEVTSRQRASPSSKVIPGTVTSPWWGTTAQYQADRLRSPSSN